MPRIDAQAHDSDCRWFVCIKRIHKPLFVRRIRWGRHGKWVSKRRKNVIFFSPWLTRKWLFPFDAIVLMAISTEIRFQMMEMPRQMTRLMRGWNVIDDLLWGLFWISDVNLHWCVELNGLWTRIRTRARMRKDQPKYSDLVEKNVLSRMNRCS